LLSSGCGHQKLRVQIAIAPDANGNAPVILSMVFVKNSALLRQVIELTAKQWFAKREQFVRDHRRELDESYYEYVPGQVVSPLEYKIPRSAGQGILFVNYSGAGPHRYVFDTAKPVQISFGSRGVALSP
jgi:type VI secretion system protein